jgi:hypothetical protein
MKILGISGTVMLHLDRYEALALANVLSSNKTLRQTAFERHEALFAEIVRQFDLCLEMQHEHLGEKGKLK